MTSSINRFFLLISVYHFFLCLAFHPPPSSFPLLCFILYYDPDTTLFLLFTCPFFLPAADDPDADAGSPKIKFIIKITIKFLFFTSLAPVHFFPCHTA